MLAVGCHRHEVDRPGVTRTDRPEVGLVTCLDLLFAFAEIGLGEMPYHTTPTGTFIEVVEQSHEHAMVDLSLWPGDLAAGDAALAIGPGVEDRCFGRNEIVSDLLRRPVREGDRTRLVVELVDGDHALLGLLSIGRGERPVLQSAVVDAVEL
jgi:hypothetical protein